MNSRSILLSRATAKAQFCHQTFLFFCVEGTGGRKGVIDRDTQTILGKSNFFTKSGNATFTVYCPKGQGSKGGWVSEKNLNCNKPTDPVFFFFMCPIAIRVS